MFSQGLVTMADMKEAAKRNRARQIEEERRPRIFDVKRRMIGMDAEALRRQMEEKKARRAAIQAEDEAYLRLQQGEAKYLNEMEARVAAEKKRILAELLEFRRTEQRAEARREFDLNDPDRLRKDIPCRLGDDDPRLTLSSMQKFEGEESAAAERRRLQADQQKAWLNQQVAEKRSREEERLKQNQQLQDSNVAVDRRVLDMANMEEECRRRLAKATIEFNKALAKEKEEEKRAEEKKDLEDTMMHINNVLTSDMLAETDMGTQSNLCPGKIIGATYRGMSAQELKQLKEFQLSQVEEAEERRRTAAAEERDWLRLSQRVGAELDAGNRQEERDRAEAHRQCLEFNARLAEEQRARNRFTKECVYSAAPVSEEFFSKFNTTTR